MILNKTLSLISIAWGEEIQNVKKIMQHCVEVFPFFDELKIIGHIDNLTDYNKFCVEEFNSFIDTDFALIVQSDGFIINPSLWNDNFLNFDYIGAPWPWHNVCGNGGFSLRSKKFLEVSSKLKYIKDHPEYDNCPEDNFLCLPQYNRKFMLDNEIKFADIKTALEFSFEHSIQTYPNHTIKNSFGFHGKFNL
jgi:hypothetical protein